MSYALIIAVYNPNIAYKHVDMSLDNLSIRADEGIVALPSYSLMSLRDEIQPMQYNIP